jgi:cytochrome c oxidase subunit 2
MLNLLMTISVILLINVFSSFTFCDWPTNWQLSFQDPASPIMEGIINLHHDIFFLLVFIAFFVITIIGLTIYSFDASKYNPKFAYTAITHNTQLEFIWTLIPCLILMMIALPSFALIYSIDDISKATFTIKVIGHQWYWTYEYGEIADDNTVLVNPLTQKPKNFDSYMTPESDLEIVDNGSVTDFLAQSKLLRLLEVDNRLVLPWKEHIRVLITSSDVIHSWAVPSLGIKMDACPGRLNQVSLFINRPGLFYGQCSEICGINHAFMPICIESF